MREGRAKLQAAGLPVPEVKEEEGGGEEQKKGKQKEEEEEQKRRARIDEFFVYLHRRQLVRCEMHPETPIVPLGQPVPALPPPPEHLVFDLGAPRQASNPAIDSPIAYPTVGPTDRRAPLLAQ